MPPFLNLPAEIRNMIYSLLLVVAEPIDLDQDCLTSVPKHSTILSTGRAVYNEAMPMLYGQNHFIFNDGFQIQEFATFTARQMIRHATFCIPIPLRATGVEEGSWRQFLGCYENYFPVLQRLELKFNPPWGSAHEDTVREIKMLLQEQNKAKEVIVTGHPIFVDDTHWARTIQTGEWYIR
jgi:hypothetical protein